jgi:hypothetical protein
MGSTFCYTCNYRPFSRFDEVGGALEPVALLGGQAAFPPPIFSTKLKKQFVYSIDLPDSPGRGAGGGRPGNLSFFNSEFILRFNTKPEKDTSMKKPLHVIVLLVGSLVLSANAVAEVGITDDCQKDIKKLRDEIKRDKDMYTSDSRARAKSELTMAQTNRLNPIKCRKNIQDAKSELRKGKKDKKNKEKEKEKKKDKNKDKD